jgi:hypothetical protein
MNKRMVNGGLLGCVATLLLVGACTDSSTDLNKDAAVPTDSSVADPNAVEPGELCERLATLQCEGETKCCEAPGRTYDSCKQAMFDGCSKRLRLDDIAMREEVGFDAEAARAAFEGFEKLAEKCDPTIAEWGSSLEGLPSMLKGTVAPDGNCAPRGALSNVAVFGAALSSCKNPETHACQPRDTQLSGMPDWTCDERSKDGGECFTDANCADGLFCDNPDRQVGASCKPRKAVGEACLQASACESLACKAGKCAEVSVEAAYCLKAE